MVTGVHIYVPGVIAISNLCFTAPTSPPPSVAATSTFSIIFKIFPLSSTSKSPQELCVSPTFVLWLSTWQLPCSGKAHGEPLLLGATARRCHGHTGFHAVVCRTNASLPCVVFGVATKLLVASMFFRALAWLGFIAAPLPPQDAYFADARDIMANGIRRYDPQLGLVCPSPLVTETSLLHLYCLSNGFFP